MSALECPNCNDEVAQIEMECSNCGFPLDGTEKEKAIFIGRQISNKSKITNAKTSQDRVQKIIYVIAAFQFLNAFLVYYRLNDLDSTIFYCILGSVLAIFGYFFNTKTAFIYVACFGSLVGILCIIIPH